MVAQKKSSCGSPKKVEKVGQVGQGEGKKVSIEIQGNLKEVTRPASFDAVDTGSGLGDIANNENIPLLLVFEYLFLLLEASKANMLFRKGFRQKYAEKLREYPNAIKPGHEGSRANAIEFLKSLGIKKAQLPTSKVFDVVCDFVDHGPDELEYIDHIREGGLYNDFEVSLPQWLDLKNF